MAGNEIWGPPLWRILHTLAERLGQQKLTLMAVDERRAWTNFIRTIDSAMPCARCRAHFKTWRLKHTIERFVNSRVIREDARQWLWALHQDVNLERGVSGLTLEEVPELYARRTNQEIQEDIRVVLESFQKGVLLRLVAPEGVAAFRKALSHLRLFV